MPEIRSHSLFRIALAMAMVAGPIVTPGMVQARESELHTFHCLHGCPIGAPATNDIVVREI